MAQALYYHTISYTRGIRAYHLFNKFLEPDKYDEETI